MVPVNEYKIADKIQSANDQLFSSNSENGISEENAEEIEEMSNRMDQLKLQQKHRVTFSSDVEEIEDEVEICETPSAVIVEYYDDNEDQINEEINEIFDRNENNLESNDRLEISSHMIIANNTDDSMSPFSPNLSGDQSHDSCGKPSKIISSNKKRNSKRTPSNSKKTKYTPRTKTPKSAENDLLKIQLNVRKCCEKKQSEHINLPRYKGYISQYGLSKDQLEHREKTRLVWQQRENERKRKKQEQKSQQSESSETAFRQWLRRKANKEHPKNKNMFDSNKKQSK